MASVPAAPPLLVPPAPPRMVVPTAPPMPPSTQAGRAPIPPSTGTGNAALLAQLQQGKRLKKVAAQQSGATNPKNLDELSAVVENLFEQLQTEQKPDTSARIATLLNYFNRIEDMKPAVKAGLQEKLKAKRQVTELEDLKKKVEQYELIYRRGMTKALYGILEDLKGQCTSAEYVDSELQCAGVWKTTWNAVDARAYQPTEFYVEDATKKWWFPQEAAHWVDLRPKELENPLEGVVAGTTLTYKGTVSYNDTGEPNYPDGPSEHDFCAQESQFDTWHVFANGRWTVLAGFNVVLQVLTVAKKTLKYKLHLSDGVTIRYRGSGGAAEGALLIPNPELHDFYYKTDENTWCVRLPVWTAKDPTSVGKTPWGKTLDTKKFNVDQARGLLATYLEANATVTSQTDVRAAVVRLTGPSGAVCRENVTKRDEILKPLYEKVEANIRTVTLRQARNLLQKWIANVDLLHDEPQVKTALFSASATRTGAGDSTGQILESKKGYLKFLGSLESFLSTFLVGIAAQERGQLKERFLASKKTVDLLDQQFPKRGETVEFATLDQALKEIERLRSEKGVPTPGSAPGSPAGSPRLDQLLARDPPECAEEGVKQEVDQLIAQALQLLNTCRPNNELAITAEVGVQFKDDQVRIVKDGGYGSDWVTAAGLQPERLLQLIEPTADKCRLGTDQLTTLWLLTGAVKLGQKPATRPLLVAASLDAAVAHYSSRYDVAIFHRDTPAEFPTLNPADDKGYVDFWRRCVVYVFQRECSATDTSAPQYALSLKPCNPLGLCAQSVPWSTNRTWVSNLCASQLAIFNTTNYKCFNPVNRANTTPEHNLRSFEKHRQKFLIDLTKKLISSTS